MGTLMNNIPGIVTKLRSAGTTLVRSPQFQLVARELKPPTPAEIPAAVRSVVQTVDSVVSKRFVNVTVGRAARIVLSSTEVICWFFVGEILGRRSLVGYKVSSK